MLTYFLSFFWGAGKSIFLSLHAHRSNIVNSVCFFFLNIYFMGFPQVLVLTGVSVGGAVSPSVPQPKGWLLRGGTGRDGRGRDGVGWGGWWWCLVWGFFNVTSKLKH